jgi:hypothetical protein
MFVVRFSFPAEKQLAGHFEVEKESQAAAQIELGHFAAAAQANDFPSS